MQVFDVTKFAKFHPGGAGVITRLAGQDVTEQFFGLHGDHVLKKYPNLVIGTIAGAKSTRAQARAAIDAKNAKAGTFGDLVPYGDPAWYQGWNSPYYNDSHRRFRAAMRKFVDEEIMPYVHQWDEARQLPKGIHKKCAEAGWLAGVIGPPWPVEYVGDKIIGGVTPAEFDVFHEMILLDELSRTGSGGIVWGLMEGLQIGMPPLFHFAGKDLRDRVAKECLSGEKVICLAITEPYAGSDVASIKTTAVKSPCGTFYTVNGEKKWITNGVFADYLTLAVRTGGPGMGGISLLLVDRNTPGVQCHQMKCGGVWASGTTYITLENVKVPTENLIGKENEGFKCIMYNFNHERWGVVVQCVRFARVCTEEAMKYAFKRKTFGKRLIDHPVIRAKLADMVRQVEATQAQLELVTYQMKTLTYAEQVVRLGGPLALLKAQATRTFEYCSRESVQIFGGAGYTRTGQGQKVERLHREVRAYSIPAGSEEIMLDLGMKQAIKYATHL